MIAEYNNAASPLSPNTEYIFTGGRMLAEERTGSGTTRFFHQDRLSTRLTTNSSGAVLGTQSHLPFGEQLTESSEQQKWKFTTYERDSETGDDYAINRGYWPTLGRFRQADRLAAGFPDPQYFNRYSYALGNPVNVVDLLGLYSSGFLSILYGLGDYFTPAQFQYSLYLGFGSAIGFVGSTTFGYTSGTLNSDYILTGVTLLNEGVLLNPCPRVPEAPPGVSVDANIAEARKHPLVIATPRGGVPNIGAAFWFRDQVKNKGPWDYKQQGRQYEAFGNFNYGATGLAVGFDERTLLREAGRAQPPGASKPEWGNPGSRLNPWGGKPPYGDDPKDQENIKRGIEYYRRKYVTKDCK